MRKTIKIANMKSGYVIRRASKAASQDGKPSL
jgi:hypothetical protein